MKNKSLIIAPFSMIGENLISKFLENGEEIIALARDVKSKKQQMPTNERIKIFEIGELQNPSQELIEELKNITHIYNLLPTNSESDLEIDNQLIELAKRYFPQAISIIFGSSHEYRGNSRSQAISENDEQNPMSKNGEIKIKQAELYKTSGLNAIYLKFANVYGYSKNFFDKNTFINTVIKNAKEGKAQFNLKKEDYCDFLYIDDLVNCVEKIRNGEKAIGETFIVGSGEKTTISEVIEEIKKYFPNVEVKTDETSENNNFSFVMDISKIKSFINWAPEISFKQGFEKTIQKLK